MIFECSFDQLMQDVGREQLVDIGTREVVGEGLYTTIWFVVERSYSKLVREHAYHYISYDAILAP